MIVLTFNAGSSSLKYALHEIGAAGERQLRARGIEVAEGTAESAACATHDAAREIRGLGFGVDAVAHRFVFGGEMDEPTAITHAVRRRLEELAPLDPLHAPQALAVLDAARSAFPGAAQVACFDTAFFTALPPIARVLAVPSHDPLLRRYGFHGLSYEFVVGALGARLGRRAIVAHLGSGSSLAAFADGKPIETTMGFSPLGGVLMSTRPGDVDPGVLLYLSERAVPSRKLLREMLERRSGLRAIAGGEGDLRILVERAQGGDRQADFAVECYTRSIVKAVGALSAILGGIDTLAFTGGVGENLPAIRAAVAQPLRHLGVALDEARNAASASLISTAGSRVAVHVVATDENLMMARHVKDMRTLSSPRLPTGSLDS